MAGDDVETRHRGREMVWRRPADGLLHLCEGADIMRGRPRIFLLWTRCKSADVPANAAWLIRPEDIVTCAGCLRVREATREAPPMTTNPPADVGPISDADLETLRRRLNNDEWAGQPRGLVNRGTAKAVLARLQAAEARAARAEDALRPFAKVWRDYTGLTDPGSRHQPVMGDYRLADEVLALTREAPEMEKPDA